MATILLSAAGSALGAGVGGSILGLSGAAIGRAVGATLGRAIDARLLGEGSGAVETGRIDRLHLSTAGEGAPVPRIWGTARLAGQVIWATRFVEHATTETTGGGKGAPRQSVTRYGYSVSLALALCEGPILRVGRVWADGVELGRDEIAMRVYAGSADQAPDPKIEAVQGAGMAPAYRGTAYVVIEDLMLERFGNRVPQFSFEVVRAADPPEGVARGLDRSIRGVALIPGTGEYAVATTPVSYRDGPGRYRGANRNAPGPQTDFALAMDVLGEELPAVRSSVFVICWFGDDLRCGQCRIRPKVEYRGQEGAEMAWQVAGLTRATAGEVPRLEGRPVYGATPADAAVIEAIRAQRAAGLSVIFYPFVLMEQMPGNGLPDPWGGAEQAKLPWRGRITCSVAPGRPGTVDGTAAADAEVAAFFAGDRGFRDFILHYARLCAEAGGVDGFCIGSEFVGLTRIRGAEGGFPAVAELRALAAEVRAILGPDCRIGYAADWTEYGGYKTPEGDLRFPLDPLWADPAVDFVGIDNYLPLSDWREGADHADAAAGWATIHDPGYLGANVEGGEYFDWYYASAADRAAQLRSPIEDGAHGEPWVWRTKDIRSWWGNAHHERIGGVRQARPTAWQAGGKPIWFTEIGCPAVDKGTNAPNLFVDPKSSESAVPPFSTGLRDDLIQQQYLRVMLDHWDAAENNPVSGVYGGRMVDTVRIHVWAYDSRPWPRFPNDRALWSDGANHALGHWLNGRATLQPLAAVVAEICAAAGLAEIDVSGLWGIVRGYTVAGVTTARAALQPLMLAYGFDAAERDGRIVFRMRGGRPEARLSRDDLVLPEGAEAALTTVRAGPDAVPGRVRLTYVADGGDLPAAVAEAIRAEAGGADVADSEMALLLTGEEAQGIAARWLAESGATSETVRFGLPPAKSWLGAGDVVALEDDDGVARRFRIERVEQDAALTVTAARVEEMPVAGAAVAADTPAPAVAVAAALPVDAAFLDLPLMRGDEVPHAPHVAVAADPWPGRVAVYAGTSEDALSLDTVVERAARIGALAAPLPAGAPGRWQRGAPLRLTLDAALSARPALDVLNGANLAAVGDGVTWEVIQFAGAELVAPGAWRLDRLLRGQAGTEAIMPPEWPAGSTVVMLDGSAVQIDLLASERDLLRRYRYGPAVAPPEDASYRAVDLAFAGVGLRPYAPCHLRARPDGAGGLRLTWLRRTRIGGDSWAGPEVPLGEAREAYLLRVLVDGAEVRRAEVAAPAWDYGGAARAADGAAGACAIEVAQLSDSYGPGPARRIEIDG